MSVDSGSTVQNKKFSSSSLSIKGKSNVTIKNCEFTVNKDGNTMLTLSNCKNCKVIDCKFHDKTTKGVGLKIAGPGSRDNLVEGCEFYRFTYSSSNGGEPMRIGNSHSSGVKMNTIVRNCYFHDLSADPETISLKCANNLVENCRHENNKSSFVIRHGGYATIRNCSFKGEGGIRIYGYGNVIEGNHFEGNKSTKFPPITLGAGNTEKDPNWTSVSTPSGKEGKSHAMYNQINKNTIKDNTYRNCTRTIYRRTDKQYRPTNSDIQNLIEGPPKTTAPTPTPTPPTPIPEPTPTPTEEPAKIQCIVCQKEDAILKLSVYVGVNHDRRTKEAMQALVAELRKTIGAS